MYDSPEMLPHEARLVIEAMRKDIKSTHERPIKRAKEVTLEKLIVLLEKRVSGI